MEPKKLPHLTLMGLGKGAGGHYDRVRIDGMGTINGDLVCNEFMCNGKSTLNGGLQAAQADVQGTARFRGPVESGRLHVSGYVKCTGSVSAEDIEVEGKLKAGGFCQAERFSARGSFRIGGLLNAGTVKIELYGGGQAKEIGGDTIHVSKKYNSMDRFFGLFFPSNRLRTDTIEGDDIYLEYTDARVVRGNRVNIGLGCRIGLVEYSGDYRETGPTRVREHRKV